MKTADRRIVFLSQWFDDSDNDGVVHSTAKALRHVGNAVVVTGPSLRRQLQPEQRKPAVKRIDRVGGLPVIRFPFYQGHSSSSIKRTLMYTSFGASSLLSVRPVFRRADVCVVYGSPITAATAAMAARRRYSVPFVLVVQDVWPDSVFASGFLTEGLPSQVAHDVLSRYTKKVYREASAVIVISRGMRELLLERGVPDHKLTVVYNWADESLLKEPVPVCPRAPHEPLRIMYGGNLGAPQGIDVLLRALARLPRSEFHLDIFGAGAEEEKLRQLADRLLLENVTFHGLVPPESMPRRMAEGHVHFVGLRAHPLFDVTVPSKVQTLLLAGVPIIGCINGEAADIIARSGAGWVSPAGDVDGLQRVLWQVHQVSEPELHRRGDKGRQFYFREMSRSVGLAQYRDVVNSVILSHQDQRV